MKNCVFCGQELLPNNPEEHIILNAIGGRLGTTDIDCGKCNAEQNKEIDCVLADELNYITNLLNVKRERRGSPAAIFADSAENNEKVKLVPGGKPELIKPIVSVQKENGLHQVSITARSESEFRQILNGYKKNGYGIDVDKEVRDAQWQSSDPGTVQITASVGSSEALRSICKSALLFYLKGGGQIEHVGDAIAYVKGEKSRDFVGHFRPADSSAEPLSVTHTIYVKGDSKEKVLYAWVEYYGTYGFGIILNENYQGQEFEVSYCFDVLEQKEVTSSTTEAITKKALFEAVKEKKFSKDILAKKHEELNRIIQERQIQEFISEKAVELASKHFQMETEITPEKLEAYYRELEQEITTMVQNQFQ